MSFTPSARGPMEALAVANWLPWPRKPLGKFQASTMKGPTAKTAHGPKTSRSRRKSKSF